MIYSCNNLEKNDIYKLMSNLVIPRPIAWVSTKSNSNILNLAPFSYFIPLSSSPATLLISIGHKKDGKPKDTLKNLRDTKKCSIVIATTNQVKSMHISATPLDYNVSEFKEFNIQNESINSLYPDTPKGSKVIFFCEYLQEVELKGSQTIPVVVEVKEIFIDDSLITNKESIKISFKDAIARVGATYFALGKELEV